MSTTTKKKDRSGRRSALRMVGAYLPDDTHEAFRKLARQNHRTVADEVRRLIDEALAENADELSAAAVMEEPVPG